MNDNIELIELVGGPLDGAVINHAMDWDSQLMDLAWPWARGMSKYERTQRAVNTWCDGGWVRHVLFRYVGETERSKSRGGGA